MLQQRTEAEAKINLKKAADIMRQNGHCRFRYTDGDKVCMMEAIARAIASPEQLEKLNMAGSVYEGNIFFETSFSLDNLEFKIVRDAVYPDTICGYNNKHSETECVDLLEKLATEA